MNNQEKLFGTIKWVAVILAIFLAVVTIKQFRSIAYVGKDVPIMNSITVTGKGEAIAKPDIATFSFGVTETAKTVEEAQKKATDKINIALKAVKDKGVDEKDIKTLSYNINPRYEFTQIACVQFCPPSKQILTGYEVSQYIEVKIRDLSKAGELFATVGSVGIQNVNNLQFTVDDMDKLKAQAREDAIKQAKEKAKKIAETLDVRISRVIGFYDSSDDMPPMYYGRESMAGDMMVKNQAPQIPTGEQKITANVNITYEIR